MTTERTSLTSNHKSKNTSQGRTHIISNNTTLHWTTTTNVKVSYRTTNTYSTGGLFTSETVISTNGMYSFFQWFMMNSNLSVKIFLNVEKIVKLVMQGIMPTPNHWFIMCIDKSNNKCNCGFSLFIATIYTIYFISLVDADQRVDNVLIYVLSSALTISLAIICVCLLYIR